MLDIYILVVVQNELDCNYIVCVSPHKEGGFAILWNWDNQNYYLLHLHFHYTMYVMRGGEVYLPSS